LLKSFVPVADEVHRLQRGKDAEARFFQGFSEQGHYGGRTQPTDTRQGVYAVAPSGQFLASVNTRNGKAMASMLEKALIQWKGMKPAQRVGKAFKPDKNTRFERFFPVDGLVLRCVSRDLKVQEELAESDWRREAWNQDFAWFRQDEVDSMLPESIVGATNPMPKPLALRLARSNLIDNVRGQTPAYKADQIKTAQITFQVTRVEGKSLHLAISGHTQAERTGKWEGGLECKILGRAVHDGQRFTQFEMVALGRRWGETKYNARSGQKESQLGVALVLDSNAPRVAPANHWIYRWR
jgi:hypothetical protein